MKLKGIIGQLRSMANNLYIAHLDAICYLSSDKVRMVFDKDNDTEEFCLSLQIDDLTDDDIAEIHSTKFQYFEPMEKILENTFSECTNNDACDFTFEIDTNHMNGPVILSVRITDYLS
jgi:hypothetical protein